MINSAVITYHSEQCESSAYKKHIRKDGGLLKPAMGADGSGGSVGVGTVSIGSESGSPITLDISNTIPFTNYGYGFTIKLQLNNLLVVPAFIVEPEAAILLAL